MAVRAAKYKETKNTSWFVIDLLKYSPFFKNRPHLYLIYLSLVNELLKDNSVFAVGEELFLSPWGIADYFYHCVRLEPILYFSASAFYFFYNWKNYPL